MNLIALWYLATFLTWGVFQVRALAAESVPPGYALISIFASMGMSSLALVASVLV